MDDGFYIETIHTKYCSNDPIFFDKTQFEWAADLEKCYPEIMESLAPVFRDDFEGLAVNPEVQIQIPPKLWKGFHFYFNGIKSGRNLKRFPLLAQKLASIPNLITASISVMEPGSRLSPHTGSTNAIIRVHFPLKIPAGFPECGMIIDNQNFSWKEGEIMMFCDMKMHSVRNLTGQRRYVLLLDVMRPEYIKYKKMVCVHIVARICTNILLNYSRSLMNVILKK